MTPAAPVATAAASLPWYRKVWADAVKVEHAVAAAIEKAASEVPEVEKFAATYGPEATALLSSASPAAGQFVTTAVSAVTVIGTAIEAGGAAAEKAFLDQGFDQTLINTIKGLWTNLKATVPASAAPAAPAVAKKV